MVIHNMCSLISRSLENSCVRRSKTIHVIQFNNNEKKEENEKIFQLIPVLEGEKKVFGKKAVNELNILACNLLSLTRRMVWTKAWNYAKKREKSELGGEKNSEGGWYFYIHF